MKRIEKYSIEGYQSLNSANYNTARNWARIANSVNPIPTGLNFNITYEESVARIADWAESGGFKTASAPSGSAPSYTFSSPLSVSGNAVSLLLDSASALAVNRGSLSLNAANLISAGDGDKGIFNSLSVGADGKLLMDLGSYLANGKYATEYDIPKPDDKTTSLQPRPDANGRNMSVIISYNENNALTVDSSAMGGLLVDKTQFAQASDLPKADGTTILNKDGTLSAVMPDLSAYAKKTDILPPDGATIINSSGKLTANLTTLSDAISGLQAGKANVSDIIPPDGNSITETSGNNGKTLTVKLSAAEGQAIKLNSDGLFVQSNPVKSEDFSSSIYSFTSGNEKPVSAGSLTFAPSLNAGKLNGVGITAKEPFSFVAKSYKTSPATVCSTLQTSSVFPLSILGVKVNGELTIFAEGDGNLITVYWTGSEIKIVSEPVIKAN